MKLVGNLISPIGSALGLFGKKSKPPSPIRPASRDDVADQMARDDELRRRRGGAADLLTGASGAEAAPVSAKTLLGQ